MGFSWKVIQSFGEVQKKGLISLLRNVLIVKKRPIDLKYFYKSTDLNSCDYLSISFLVSHIIVLSLEEDIPLLLIWILEILNTVLDILLMTKNRI